MKVVWVYRDYRHAPERYRSKVAGDCEIISDREFRTFSGCLATWQLLAPKLIRTLYVDQSIYNFFNKKGILGRFDEIHVVNFEKELDNKWPGITFFAAPKLWVISQQKEPFILVDTETMLFKPLSEWYHNDYHFITYEETNPIRIEHWTSEDFVQYGKIRKELGSYGIYLQPSYMINAGLTSWPDVNIANAVGNLMLTVCEKVCLSKTPFRFKWTFCEESIIRSLIYRYVPESLVHIHSLDWKNLEFVEWSSPETVPHVYEDFKWWAAHHPGIKVEDLKSIDSYAEY